MLTMRTLAGVAICLAFCSAPQAQNRKAGTEDFPDQFEIGRLTYFDFGPPFDYYEIFMIRPRRRNDDRRKSSAYAASLMLGAR